MSTMVNQPAGAGSSVIRRSITGALVLAVCAVIGALLTGLIPWPFGFEVTFLGLLPVLVRGLGITIVLTVAGAILALILSLIVGVARCSSSRLIRALMSVYVEFFRGTSILVQLFWIYFVLPSPPFNLSLTALQAGILALGLNVGAYGSEIVRGAIKAVPKEQVEAATALNMSPYMRMLHVVLPQALRRMVPPFGNLLIELLKATSLVSLITLADITFQGRLVIQSAGRMGEVFLMLMVIYFLLAYPMVLGTRWIERRRKWE